MRVFSHQQYILIKEWLSASKTVLHNGIKLDLDDLYNEFNKKYNYKKSNVIITSGIKLKCINRSNLLKYINVCVEENGLFLLSLNHKYDKQ